MGRSCGNCCSCCECSEILEDFSLRLGDYYDFVEYFVDELRPPDSEGVYDLDSSDGLPKRYPKCKVVKVQSGYTPSDKCNEESRSDMISGCTGPCRGASRRWYLVEFDNCVIHYQGEISCDGALLDLPHRFRYSYKKNELDEDNKLIEHPNIIPDECDLAARFQLFTCCIDPTRENNFDDNNDCEHQVKQPLCESCAGVTQVLFSKTLTTTDNRWYLCQYFDKIFTSLALYETFTHGYDGSCPINCKEIDQSDAYDDLFPISFINMDGELETTLIKRNYRRFWALHEFPVISPELNKCCGVILKGEVDVFGRLIPPVLEEPMPEQIKTCGLCLDGSWPCNQRIRLAFSGDINGPDQESTMLPLTTNDILLKDSSKAFEDWPQHTEDIPIRQLCAGLDIEYTNWSAGSTITGKIRDASSIYIWRPVFHSLDPDDPFNTDKYKFEYKLGSAEGLDNKYSIRIEYVDDFDLTSNMGTYFLIYFDLYFESGYWLSLVLKSDRICHTSDGKFDCNLLRDGIPITRVVSSNFSTSNVFYLENSQYFANKMINSTEPRTIVDDTDSLLLAGTNAEFSDPCVQGRAELPCNFYLEWNRATFTTLDPIFNANSLTKTFALSVCCCDTTNLVELNKRLVDDDITNETDCAGLTPDCEVDPNPSIKCRCSQLDEISVCSLKTLSELAVIIIDESSDYWRNCVHMNCGDNVTYIQDLAAFRTATNGGVDIVLWQPTIGCPRCSNVILDCKYWLFGACPVIEEVIQYDQQVPRNNPQNTFDRLKIIFETLVQGLFGTQQGDGTYRYSAMNIYRDTSGSVTNGNYSGGVTMFLNYMKEFYPDFRVTDTTFGDERWLLYAAKNKSGSNCYGRSFHTRCNENVIIHGIGQDNVNNSR